MLRPAVSQITQPTNRIGILNPNTLLVAVALSAKATDVGVNRATRGLFAVADKPEKMVILSIFGIAPGKTLDALKAKLLRRVHELWKKGAHHRLILHGP